MKIDILAMADAGFAGIASWQAYLEWGGDSMRDRPGLPFVGSPISPPLDLPDIDDDLIPDF